MRTSSTIGLISLVALIACSSTVETVTVPGQAPGTGDGTSTDTDGTDPAQSGLPVKAPSTDPNTPPGPVVDGLAISELAVFQGVKVDLLANDKWISSRNAQNPTCDALTGTGARRFFTPFGTIVPYGI